VLDAAEINRGGFSEPLQSVRRQDRECRPGVRGIRLPAYQSRIGELVDDAADPRSAQHDPLGQFGHRQLPIGCGGQLEQHVVPGQRQSRAGAKLPVENRHQLRMHLE